MRLILDIRISFLLWSCLKGERWVVSSIWGVYKIIHLLLQWEVKTFVSLILASKEGLMIGLWVRDQWEVSEWGTNEKSLSEGQMRSLSEGPMRSLSEGPMISLSEGPMISPWVGNQWEVSEWGTNENSLSEGPMRSLWVRNRGEVFHAQPSLPRPT